MTSDFKGRSNPRGSCGRSRHVHSDTRRFGAKAQESRFEITADAYPYHDWSRLIGTPVEIRKDFSIVRAGIVDDVMPDSSALWLASDGSQGRQLFAAAEGYRVWIRPRKLAGKLCYKMAAKYLPPPTP